MYSPYLSERLYIAGPECFYPRGYDLWWAQRKLAEYHGIPVVLPTTTELKLSSSRLQENAAEIFEDLIIQANQSTAIIADLEFFRGTEPDGGTVFELGWIWAIGGTLFGYSRDLRPMRAKNQHAFIKSGKIFDQHNLPLPYRDLPFCPSIIGSTILVEGGFPDALQAYIACLNERRKRNAYNQLNADFKLSFTCSSTRPVVYLSGPERYQENAEQFYQQAKDQLDSLGYETFSPIDTITSFPKPDTEDPYTLATWRFLTNMALLKASNVILANLQNFHGFEPNNDVSFECGAAYTWKKLCIGYMPDLSIMRKRIPNQGPEYEYVDLVGNTVENFDYPINLMFACTFSLIEGNMDDAIRKLRAFKQ